MKIKSQYLHAVYDTNRFRTTVDRLTNKIAEFSIENEFDAIAFTGTSGAALAYPISYKLNIPLLCVRKSTDKSHYKHKVEGIAYVRNYIIIDDFIESGSTCKEIIKSVERTRPTAMCTGIFLYSGSDELTNFKYGKRNIEVFDCEI